MKKSAYAIIALVIFLAMMIINNLNMGNEAEKLQQERDNLTEQVAAFKDVREKNAAAFEETAKENERLKNNADDLKKEIDRLNSPVLYQDFLDAVRTVEDYKEEDSFNKAKDYFGFSLNGGFSPIDRAGNCPCSIHFKTGSIDWEPNSVLDLKEIGIEGEKIVLTYQTADMIRDDYQFIMSKTKGFDDETLRWRIEEVKTIKK
ncbi:hypothetical protein [Peribacillus frigoritolerans]|uniref:hypothetical protein n=1 Tax=Peribacillus frigoritolerans TaxID=450367 RepID=UPI00105A5943|nr:hypothetical protein [Peribacillus frigoritolerans]TDL82403.1 hypothetical protein E2R53_02165 [Peribacillus frigoritolerans]